MGTRKKTLKKYRILPFVLLWALSACGKSEAPPINVADSLEIIKSTADTERNGLETLRKSPSVTTATIEDTFGRAGGRPDQYAIDLEHATASVCIAGQEEEVCPLDDAQVEGLRRLLSEYALTVYDGAPYWPTGDYCTMELLFYFSVYHDGGTYQENGATRYPDGWAEFIENMKGLIFSEHIVEPAPPPPAMPAPPPSA